jgi:hypothetical protein
MKTQPLHLKALALHIGSASPCRELTRPKRDQHRWLRIALVGAIPVIGLVTAIVELIRLGVH